MKRSKKVKRMQTRGEEVANAITHGVSALIVLICSPIMAIVTYNQYGVVGVISTTVFSLSIFAMFFSSCLYHSLSNENKRVFHLLDHIFIFIAIAGTYTPIALIAIGGWAGWLLFSLQYLIVVAGTIHKIIYRKNPKSSVAFYLAMGWLIIFFLYSFITECSWQLILCIAFGGILYSVGAYFYKRKYPFAHMIWHLFVLLAAASQYLGILFFL